MREINDIKKLVGNTPLIKINFEYNNKQFSNYFKAEWYNLTGSIKDRVALSIFENGYKNGTLRKNQEIVEVTSGNMGISLTAIGKYLGHNITIFMPKFMSVERKQILKLYGANLIETENFEEAFEKSEKYAKENNAFLAHQFENKDNFWAHYTTTAKEILNQTETINGFIAGVGTSGTLSGVGTKLKEKLDVIVFALEPKSSLILSTGKSQGKHKLQGLSDEIIPKLYNKNLIDEIISVSDEDAIAMSQKLSKELGLGVGISSGANFIGSVLTNLNNIVSVFPDDNKKYLSTDLAIPISTPLVDSIRLINYEIIK